MYAEPLACLPCLLQTRVILSVGVLRGFYSEAVVPEMAVATGKLRDTVVGYIRYECQTCKRSPWLV